MEGLHFSEGKAEGVDRGMGGTGERDWEERRGEWNCDWAEKIIH